MTSSDKVHMAVTLSGLSQHPAPGQSEHSLADTRVLQNTWEARSLTGAG